MDDRVQLAIDHPDRLVAFFTVNRAMRADNNVIDMGKYPLPERQPQSVLEAIGFILCRVEFKLHRANCVNHI
jgi:hypothetical protein